MKGKLNVDVINNAAYLGELCNNPLNIMGNDAWQGKVGNFSNSAGGYCVFGVKDGIPGWVWGYRAAFVDWSTKQRKWGSLTLRKLINAWAPASAVGHNNNPDAYMQSVAKNAGVVLDQELQLSDRNQAIRIARAMTVVECSRCIYGDEDIGWGWDLANGVTKPKPMSQSVTVKAVIGTGTAAVVGKVADNPQVQEVINSTLPQIAQSAGIPGWIGWIFLGLVLIGAGTAFYRLRQDRKKDV